MRRHVRATALACAALLCAAPGVDRDRIVYQYEIGGETYTGELLDPPRGTCPELPGLQHLAGAVASRIANHTGVSATVFAASRCAGLGRWLVPGEVVSDLPVRSVWLGVAENTARNAALWRRTRPFR